MMRELREHAAAAARAAGAVWVQCGYCYAGGGYCS